MIFGTTTTLGKTLKKASPQMKARQEIQRLKDFNSYLGGVSLQRY